MLWKFESVTEKDKQSEAFARFHRIVCDQPFNEGGSDTGMTPPELMLSALDCAMHYAAEYLRARRLPFDSTELRISAIKRWTAGAAVGDRNRSGCAGAKRSCAHRADESDRCLPAKTHFGRSAQGEGQFGSFGHRGIRAVTQERLPPHPSVQCVAPARVAATRPDPSAYLGKWVARDGSSVTIRPIRLEDEPGMVRFHASLSDRSVYLRYFHHLSLDARVNHERLTQVCFVDYDRATVLVAESASGDIVGIGRLAREPGSPDAEFAMLVSDAWHEHGLGTELLRRLIALSRDQGIRHVFGDILNENCTMQKICRQLGFELHFSIGDGVVKAFITLDENPPANDV